ncbi:MAG: metalloregulator ArsR/SmtB family transcription factor [Planctomycetaceae bacterium]|nr:metalloregulator ArsR/SmtB family transcription factor [Planctomycetaceae bacterium]
MDRKHKKLVYEKQAEILKALAHPVRIAILDFLKDGEQCVCYIAEYVASERSNVSKHLSILESCGILESRKEGLNMIYSLKAKCIMEFFHCITNCLKQEAKDSEKLLKVL